MDSITPLQVIDTSERPEVRVKHLLINIVGILGATLESFLIVERCQISEEELHTPIAMRLELLTQPRNPKDFYD